ncbi:hypothetical protein PANI_CDS0018 [Maribacter phage Panino]
METPTIFKMYLVMAVYFIIFVLGRAIYKYAKAVLF